MAKPAKQTATHDYLAIIPIGTGSSWGRSPIKETAITNAVTALKDWTVYYDLANTEVAINVVDVIGYGNCVWGGHSDGYLHGVNEVTGKDEVINRPVERVTRMTPKWKRS